MTALLKGGGEKKGGLCKLSMAKVGASPAANLLLIRSPCNSNLEFLSDADGWQTALMATLHRAPSTLDFVVPSLYAEYPRNGLDCCAVACCVLEEEDDHR